MRGENTVRSTEALKSSGSSPHARGKLETRPSIPADMRLIPACAGKTQQYEEHAKDNGAHPRMRGENHSVYRLVAVFEGSSPHARGKLVIFAGVFIPIGLIPACAGKTKC
ncbi:hypothetical protein HMPREF1292_00492 [Corynebacterium sp. KPL1995]|nr:hypothetical protein HMPREF1292_00492 [Corynebacterium sp. KPL1995]ERS75420.1 hypothetical protein HMPREF1290_00493 [Corynebacterium sp. KPL1989]